MNEAAFNDQKQQVQAIAKRSGGEDRGVHIRHVEQLLRLEHALSEPIGRANEHLGDHNDDQRERHAVSQAHEGLRQRFEPHP